MDGKSGLFVLDVEKKKKRYCHRRPFRHSRGQRAGPKQFLLRETKCMTQVNESCEIC